MRRIAPNAHSILDLAAGYGTAVFHGNQIGLNVFGIEPNAEKVATAHELLREAGLPLDWQRKILRAYGENLPFSDGSFDAVTSYQTLEHVQDLHGVLRECIRITRSGGGIHIHCPDYSGTFEGHYQLPWFPYLPHAWAMVYLRLLGRPLSGWQGIQPMTRHSLQSTLKHLQKQMPQLKLTILNLRYDSFQLRLSQKFPKWSGLLPTWAAYCVYRAWRAVKTMFRAEKPLHVWVSVQRISSP